MSDSASDARANSVMAHRERQEARRVDKVTEKDFEGYVKMEKKDNQIERVCPKSIASPRGLMPCIRENCMAWRSLRKNCKLIDHD